MAAHAAPRPARLVAAHEVAAPLLQAEVVAAPAANPEPPSGLLERAKRIWPARRTIGTTWNFWNYLERPKGYWNARSAIPLL